MLREVIEWDILGAAENRKKNNKNTTESQMPLKNKDQKYGWTIKNDGVLNDVDGDDIVFRNDA